MRRLLSASVGTTQQQIQFSGALTWNESGTLINKYKSGEDIWVGFPSPEMDELWDSLEEGQSPDSSCPTLSLPLPLLML